MGAAGAEEDVQGHHGGELLDKLSSSQTSSGVEDRVQSQDINDGCIDHHGEGGGGWSRSSSPAHFLYLQLLKAVPAFHFGGGDTTKSEPIFIKKNLQ